MAIGVAGKQLLLGSIDNVGNELNFAFAVFAEQVFQKDLGKNQGQFVWLTNRDGKQAIMDCAFSPIAWVH